MKTIYELKLKDIYESAINRYFTEKRRLLKQLELQEADLKIFRAERDNNLKKLQSEKVVKETAVSDMFEKTPELITELSSMSDSVVKSMLITEINNIVNNKQQELFDVEVQIRKLDSAIVETEHKIDIIARSLSILDAQYPIFAFLSEEEARNKYETYIQI